MLIMVILAYLLLFWVDIVPLYKQKEWMGLVVNSVLGAGSLTIAIMLVQGVIIPSPEAPIRDFITSLFGK